LQRNRWLLYRNGWLLCGGISGYFATEYALQDADVQAKARAAAQWCAHATEHEKRHNGKPWVYLLIPHDAIADNKMLKGFSATYQWSLQK